MKRQRTIVDGVAQAPSRAMLHAVGFTREDFQKPQIGIASTWSNLSPCNMHINKLAEEAARGADAAGGKAVTFNTITVSDGISMGTPGMRYSLVSREVIADSIETVVGAQGFDGFVAVGGCDKNMPGCAMAIARLDRPAVFVYGGTIQPGAERRDVISVFEAVGGHSAGNVTDAELIANPGLVKTMSVQPPRGAGRVRLIRIGEGDAQVDLQPCGGTHVARTGEIGAVTLGKVEKKGARNRRVNMLLA